MHKQISCMKCKTIFWTKTKKMFVVWRARITRQKQFLYTESKEEADNFKFPEMPLEADPREYKKVIDEVTKDGKTTYAVWLARLGKLETYGAYPSYAEAMNAKMIDSITGKPVVFEPNEQRYIEKIYCNTENYCGNCKRFFLSIQKRVKADQKMRAKKAGLKENAKVMPITDADARGFMKYMVEQKIQAEQKIEQERLAKEKQKPIDAPKA